MVLYYCEACNKPFDRKSSYISHRKIHSFEELSTKKVIQNTTCQYCKKTFVNIGKLNYHVEKICKEAPNKKDLDRVQTMHIQIAKIKNEMKAEIKAEIKAEFDVHKEKIEHRLNLQHGQIQAITDAVNEIIEMPTININIDTVLIQAPILYINDFKTEKSLLHTLNHDQMLDAIRSGGDAVTKLIKFKHYNPELPINHNIALKQKRSDIVQVFNGNKFVDIPIEELLDYLINTAQDEITQILMLPNIKITSMQQKHIYKLQLGIKENKPETISMLKEELRKLMYDNYDLVMATYKKLIFNVNKAIE